ncbi:MAG: hypothetical protein H0X30_34295 [Anaerolineae bacterium]|nr:hypothetical protein [Anaerolineae bacterium]
MSWFRHRKRVMLFIAVLVVAALARLLTFERFLPLTDYADELNMYMLALDWRGAPLGEAYGAERVGDWLGSYPPLFVWGEMGVQSALDKAEGGRWIASGTVVFWTRLLSVGFGILTAALLFDTGQVIGGLLAGTLAGLAWALAVPILEFNSLAIPDPLVYLMCAAALWGAARAFKQESFRWVLVGVIGAIGAIYTKYVPIYALIPPLGAMVWLTYQRKPGALRWWIIIGVVGALTAGLLLYSITNHPLTNGEAKAAQQNGIHLLLNAARNWDNLRTMIAPLGVVALALAAGSLLLVLPRAKKIHVSPFIVSLVLYTLPVVPLSALVSDTGGRAGGEIRHVMPGVMAVILLWSVALALVMHRWRTFSRPLARVAAMLSLVVWIVPTLAGDLALVVRFIPPNIVYQLWTWSDISLPADGLIMTPTTSAITFTWNRPWSGYNGQTDFKWWTEDYTPGSMPADYAKRGITYYTFTDDDRKTLDTPDFRAFVDQLQPIKVIHPQAPSAGSTVYFYRMLPPENPSGVVLGNQIQFVGYDLAPTASGKSFNLRFYWKAVHPPTSNYSVFVHLTAAKDQTPIAQYDGAPTTPRYLTLQWNDPAELHISGDITITAPDDTPAGDYRLQIGLYDFTSGVRLTTPDGQDSIEVPIQIK